MKLGYDLTGCKIGDLLVISRYEQYSTSDFTNKIVRGSDKYWYTTDKRRLKKIDGSGEHCSARPVTQADRDEWKKGVTIREIWAKLDLLKLLPIDSLQTILRMITNEANKITPAG